MSNQRNPESLKQMFKGLWSQYSSGGGAPSNDNATARGTTDLVAQPVEEMLLFPTFAYRDERLKVWRVQVRGWAYCRNPSTRRVRLAAALIRRFIRVPPGSEPDQLLVDRVSYLFAAQPVSSDLVKVAMAGIAEPAPFELHTTRNHIIHPPVASNASSGSRSLPPPVSKSSSDPRPVNLLDAPIVLTTNFDPTNDNGIKGPQSTPHHSAHRSSQHPAGNGHARVVRNPFVGVEPTIIQKALQIDAFSWQNLILDEGLFQGEILLGYNELEWLIQSYEASHTHNSNAHSHLRQRSLSESLPPAKPKRGIDFSKRLSRRRLVELRGKLFSWHEEQIVSGLAHLIEPRGVSIISDIDDTIKASNITAQKRIVLETAFARPMKAVPGMSELYRDWYRLGCEFHYVSNSPWQLYPSLDHFFHTYKFPPGSAHLRSFDPNDLLSIKNYTGTPQLKRDTIELLFSILPNRKYVLVGDCGEHDLETYTELARRFPSQVLRIYIRDVFAPMSVAAVTTDTAIAGNTVGQGGLIPYGIVPPTASRPAMKNKMNSDESDLEADLMRFDLSEDDHAASGNCSESDIDSQKMKRPAPPPVPPKPSHLQQHPPTGSVPPPKPPRRTNAIDNCNRWPQQFPGAFESPEETPPYCQPNNVPLDPSPPPLDNLTAAERIESQISQVREQAEEWLAFYAQKFYVAQTQSFLRCSHLFMPTVEKNMHIIDYEAVSASAAAAFTTADDSQVPPPHHSHLAGSALLHHAHSTPALPTRTLSNGPPPPPISSVMSSLGSFSIPKPPPPEAQLARTSRRLLLWKRYQLATQGLPPDLCRLFVDASDISQDFELFDSLIPDTMKNGIPSE